MNVKNEAELTRTERVAIFLRDNKKSLIIAAVAFVLILVAVGVFEYLGNQKAEKSVLAAEVIESKLNVYLTAADEDKVVVKEELSSLIEAAGNDYKGLYAHMRALNAEAQVLAEEGDWTGAAASYIAIADNFPDSYMAPVSLLNASAMEEESGDIETALTLLERVIAEYKDLSADIPEALFNMGRLNEGLGDPVKAQEYYNRISDDYSSSSWTNLAKSRIIALNARS